MRSADLQPFYFVAAELDVACAQLAPEYDYDWFDLAAMALRPQAVGSVITGAAGAGLARDSAWGINASYLWHESKLDAATTQVDCLTVIAGVQKRFALLQRPVLVVAAAAWGEKLCAGLQDVPSPQPCSSPCLLYMRQMRGGAGQLRR